jgi:hypothetical protein
MEQPPFRERSCDAPRRSARPPRRKDPGAAHTCQPGSDVDIYARFHSSATRVCIGVKLTARSSSGEVPPRSSGTAAADGLLQVFT